MATRMLGLLAAYQPTKRKPVAAEAAGTMTSPSKLLKVAETLKSLKGMGKKK